MILLSATFLRILIGSIFYNLFIAPLKGLWEVSGSLLPENSVFLKFILFAVLLCVICSSARAVLRLLNVMVQYVIFFFKQRKGRIEREIRKQERERILKNIADNKQFDEMYEQYVCDGEF